jgi:U4/U6 small nuclear ribonucleoprotein PRP31
MGQTKLTASSRAGLFTSGAKPHTGILSECEMVQSCPKHLQRQVLKMIASKVALAACVDCVPDLETRKRRGGKRIRRLKENYEETELIKQANKRVFSQSTGEYGDDAMGLTMGMLDSAQGGALCNKASIQKLRQSNTKASRKKAAQMAAQATNPGSLSSHATSGMASSMAFTPVQGLELVDPSARVKKANEKWFTENAGFQSALPKQT